MTPTAKPKVDIYALPVHEMADILPMLTDQENAQTEDGSYARSALLESIREHGITTHLTLWRDEANTLWLIDGRNRREAARQLMSEGLAVSIPCHEFKGSEAKAFAYIRETNLKRRTLTAGQIAAVTVKAAELANRYLSRSTDKDDLAQVQQEEKEGRFVERLAKQSGVSTGYLGYSITLHKHAPNLLDDVIHGRISLAQAILQYRASIEPKEPEPTTPTSPTTAGTAPASKKAVVDGLKRLVPESFVHLFESRDTFRVLAKKTKALEKELLALCKLPGAANLPKREIKDAISLAIRYLNEKVPHVICPACDGSGETTDEAGECDHCDGAGFLDASQYAALPEALKQATQPQPVTA